MVGTSAVARLIFFCCVCLLLLSQEKGIVLAEANGSETVYQQIEKSSKPATGEPASPKKEDAPLVSSPDGWSLLLQFIFSLGLIILLMYLLLRFLAKRQIGGAGRNGGMKVISSVSVGNGKSLQVVQIGDTLYVVGVGDTVTLLRHIPAGDEMDTILSDAEMMPSTVTGKWEDIFARMKRRKQTDGFDVTEELETPRSFGEILDKQWDEVASDNKMELWDDETHRSKGDRL